MSNETTPTCPKCKSVESVIRVQWGCRCLSCPPWWCDACHDEFFDDDEEDNDE